MKLYLFPLIIFIIMLVYSILIIKDNRGLDNKLLYTMLFKYSVVLLFAIVEYLYLNKLNSFNNINLILIVLNIIISIMFGKTIHNICKQELDDNTLLKLSRASIYIMLETIVFVALILINQGTL